MYVRFRHAQDPIALAVSTTYVCFSAGTRIRVLRKEDKREHIHCMFLPFEGYGRGMKQRRAGPLFP